MKKMMIAAMVLGVFAANAQEKLKKQDSQKVTVYGSFRPSVTYRNDRNANIKSVDVTDFFSRLGFKAEQKIDKNLTAFVQGEWDIDIEGDADFGDARLGYAGLKGNWGRIAIGKQWSPHYNIIAEVTDVFNHRSSPFAYDTQSPFRTNNLVTYKNTLGNFKIDAGVQINGDSGSTNGGVTDDAYGRSYVDTAIFGVGYTAENFYLGASFLSDKDKTAVKRDIFAFAASTTLFNNLYTAINYQNITIKTPADVKLDASTLDVAAVYSFNESYNAKASYFNYDNGTVNGNGFNFTFEKRFKKSVRTYIEVLNYNDSDKPAITNVSVGLRYDLSYDLL
ncbi:porin [Tenacibaculum finnmarkense]|uniref:porin n=1 Tax=Tenacibaculum finnmarkense TaxID=2781243 RepID=UPI00187B70AA|nr:porin [Tenacibaculum finnmarkense]MBE7693635.1 porin [Tenacibaculum finnmarkense genomovar finnmarkense]MCD8403599.1 porin [Tenacibaculum finnmarkense genomovar finnmarkense]MCD8447996.1 porin [Tenacibaculum finnmarkense genomovar finnmarkense]MCG8806304.1 porin [Tenacibaculum finnmarkense]MCG8857513.1 porin [Tenacibaculum finnmarkense]